MVLLRAGVAILFALLSLTPSAWAQGNPVGPEFRVNTFTTSYQRSPAVATDPAGNFLVVWAGNLEDGSGAGVFGQRYASSGTPLGGEFRVNTFTISGQDYPSLAFDPSGNFIVVWESFGQDGSNSGIFAQRYASTGAPLGGEFRVNTFTTGIQTRSAVAFDAVGNFLVAWGSDNEDGSDRGVFAQRYLSTGAPLGGPFRINTYTTNFQRSPSVASDSAGNFVIAWESYTQDGSGVGIFAQRYASTGAPLGAEFQVNTYVTYHQFDASVDSDSGGNFVVTWTSGPIVAALGRGVSTETEDQDGSGRGVFARRYASTGVPLGPEFRVNTYTTSHQSAAKVASDAAGNFIVTWSSLGQEGATGGVYGQRYLSSGTPLGAEFRVNSFTTNGGGHPSVASDPSGNFVVVWVGNTIPPGTFFQEIFGQRYNMIVPVELQSFRVE